MIIKKAIKKPIEVEYLVFNGDNHKECLEFIGDKNVDNTLNYPNIITSEGTMIVSKGDYIIKEPFDKDRKFYPCKPYVFNKTYSLINTKTGVYKPSVDNTTTPPSSR